MSITKLYHNQINPPTRYSATKLLILSFLTLTTSIIAITLAAEAIALFVALHPCCQCHCLLCCPPPLCHPPSLSPLPSPCRPCPLSHMLPLLVDCFFSSLLQMGGVLGNQLPLLFSRQWTCPTSTGHSPLMPFAFFVTNAGTPKTALGVGIDGIAYLNCGLGGEPTGEPTHGNLMAGKAGTRTSYYSSGGALVASRHPPLQHLAMVGCCVLC